MRIMQPVYLALGDSMSVDAYAGGPGRGAASLLHHNRDADFPNWAGRDLHTRDMVTGVAQRAERILDTLRAMTGPDPTIVVSTVYDPSDGTGVLPNAGLPAWWGEPGAGT
jgi:hypothetical protein